MHQELERRIVESARTSSKRHFFFDWDGTLRERNSLYVDAEPTEEIESLLRTLSEEPRNEVHLVTGRGRDNVESWFGAWPIHLSAEHGYFVRHKKERTWSSLVDLDLGWKETLYPLLEEGVRQVPRTKCQAKEASLGWYYPEECSREEKEAIEAYTELLRQKVSPFPVDLKTGHGAVEVRPKNVHKGLYVDKVLREELMSNCRNPSAYLQPATESAINRDGDFYHQTLGPFILCVGDDKTDMDMYEVLPEHAMILHVAQPCARATGILSSPKALRALLRKIIEEDHGFGTR